MSWYLAPWKKYATFNGRATRREYWAFTAGNIAVMIVLAILMVKYVFSLAALAITAFTVAIIVPGVAVAVRRLHDCDKSGWFFLLGLVPVVGPIWTLVYSCLQGDRGPNRYGPDPRKPAREVSRRRGSVAPSRG
jgi:uncharacterized membrane protein YhaH (DUF805 family)